MKGSDLLEMGMPRAVVPEAFQLIRQMAGRGVSGEEMRRVIAGVLQDPRSATGDPEGSPARWRRGFSRVRRASRRARSPRRTASGARGWSRERCSR